MTTRRDVRNPKVKQTINKFMLSNFSVYSFCTKISYCLPDKAYTRAYLNPFETIVSSLAHVAISLKKTRKVLKPIRVSCFSIGSSPEVIGGKVIAGGGSM